MLHKHLLSSPVSTKDATQASIFFVPVYLGRLFNHQWQQFSDPSNAWLINRECHGLSAWDCWAEKWDVAVNVSTSTPPYLCYCTLQYEKQLAESGLARGLELLL